jgi:hypothetical protein
MTTALQAIASQTAEAFADKIFRAALGTMETFNLYLGDHLGWFDALAEAPATAAELAERTRPSRATRSSGDDGRLWQPHRRRRRRR